MERALYSNRDNEHGYDQKDHNKNILMMNTNMMIRSILTMSILTMSILTMSILTMSTVEVIIK